MTPPLPRRSDRAVIAAANKLLDALQDITVPSNRVGSRVVQGMDLLDAALVERDLRKTDDEVIRSMAEAMAPVSAAFRDGLA